MKKIKILIGGTFEIIHQGHLKLLKTAFQLVNLEKKKCILYIGLTNYKNNIKTHKISEYTKRKKTLLDVINNILTKEIKIRPNKLNYKIIELSTDFGISLIGNYNYFIVSTETKKNALLVNKIRTNNYKKKIQIIEVKMELDETSKIISTTRILNNEIDGYGKIIS